MEFHSANALKTSLFALFAVLVFVWLLVDVWMALTDETYLSILFGSSAESRGLQAFHFIPLPFLILWIFAPSTYVELDRSTRTVHYRQGRTRFTFPWTQVTFNHQWYPTKSGGATLFSLLVAPPFPDTIQRMIEKKGRSQENEAYQFRLGSFDVKGPEHGRAIFGFLDAWMRSQDLAEVLYSSWVLSHFPD